MLVFNTLPLPFKSMCLLKKLVISAILILSPIAYAEKCAFTTFAVEGWAKGDVRWDGECKRGHAEGLGVLKLFSQGKVDQIFYGRLHAGEPVSGLIDMNGSFMVGKFRKGHLIEPTKNASNKEEGAANEASSDYMFIGFYEAEEAAKFIASKYKKAGNEKSAAFYENKASHMRDMLGE